MDIKKIAPSNGFSREENQTGNLPAQQEVSSFGSLVRLHQERRPKMSARKRKDDYVAPYEFSDAWDEVLLGDRDLFKEMTAPFIPALIEAAGKDIKRERMNGNLPPDTLWPAELVGEALVQAWIRRYSRSSRESLYEWLLANQRWALRLLILEEKNWATAKAISLEEPAKPRHAGNDNDEWDWITPQFTAREYWRDIIADENSLSHAV